MAISTYAELTAAVARWLDDSTLTDVIPDMVTLAEAEFNRRLNTMEMEARGFTTTDGEYVTLPDDFQSLRAVYLADADYVRLEQMSLQELRAAYGYRVTGQPVAYAIVDDQIVLAPVPDGARRLEIIYVANIPALTDANQTNWLLTAHPDLYLFGTLQQAEFFNWQDDRVALVNARVEAIMKQVADDGKGRRAGAAPLRMRAGATP